MHKLTDSVSAGLSAGQATLQAFQNMTHNLDILQKSLPNFSQVVGKIKSLSEAIYQLTQSKKLEQATQSFAKIFSQNNLSNMSAVLDNLSSLGKKINSSSGLATGKIASQVQQNLEKLFSLAQTSLPESLNKKLSSLSQHKTVRSQEINHTVWQSMDSLATSVHTASPVSVMAALETPLSAMSSTLRQEASYLPENSTGSTSTVQNSSAYNYSSPNLNTYDIERIASAVVDKMIQTLSLFLVSKAASSKTQSDTSSISNESHLNNLQKNLNNIDAQKTLNNLNTITNIVRDVEKNIVSSVSAISEVTQTINNYTHAAISHIQKQGQEALNNLVEIYTGNLGLITKAQVELETFQEERQTEEEQEYAYQQSVYEKELLQLEATLAGETNIRNAKKLEQEIENKRRKKREQEEQRLSDLAEAKRQEELDQKEQELLKAKQLREWEYEVQKTQIQNAVGQAQAEAEHQVAIITKVTQTAQLTGQIAMASANAAINMANPLTIGIGIAQLAAAGAAAAQIGLIAATPLPPAYSPAPLPVRPFADGGIVPALPGGLPITFGTHRLGVMSETGYDEMVLPLTQMNIDRFLKPFSQNLSEQTLSYAPQINIHIDGQKTPEETLAYIRQHLQRDLFETVEEAQQRFRLRSK